MPEIIFAAENLTKKYGKKYALNELNMEIHRGDIYGLIGKNGSGKTTLMRILTGRAMQTSGKIELFGKSKTMELCTQRGRVGGIVESPAFFPTMTAKDNLEVIRLQHEIKGKYCIKEALQAACLEESGSKKVKDFSLGMKQRLGIAMALIGRPEFIVLDEPVNGLDPEGIVKLRELLQMLNQKYGITILISSHILSELDQLATCYGFIHNGRITEQIAADKIYEQCSLEEYYMRKVTIHG